MTLVHGLSCFMFLTLLVMCHEHASERLNRLLFPLFSDSSQSCSTFCWLPMELVWMQKRLCTLQCSTDTVSSR